MKPVLDAPAWKIRTAQRLARLGHRESRSQAQRQDRPDLYRREGNFATSRNFSPPQFADAVADLPRSGIFVHEPFRTAFARCVGTGLIFSCRACSRRAGRIASLTGGKRLNAKRTRWSHESVSVDDERNLLVGLIVSDDFCRKLLPLTTRAHLTSAFANRVLDWVRSHFKRYNKAPRREIESIFKLERRRAKETNGQAEIEIIEETLASLSDYHVNESDGEEIDWTYRADLSATFLRRRNLDVLLEQVKTQTGRGHIDRAEQLVRDYAVIGTADDGARLSVNDLEERLGKIEWLWRSWIPRGYVTILAGAPKSGKSLLALHLAGVACGALQIWPDNTRFGKASGYVIWAEAEGRMQVNLQRLNEFRIPTNRIILPLPKGQELQAFRLDSPAHLAALRAATKKYQPRLIVLDALRAAHGGKENESDIARILVELSIICRDHGTAALVLHHTRKGQQGGRSEVSLDDLRGSSAIAAAAVSVLGLDTPDKTRPEARRLSLVAANLAEPQDPIGFMYVRDGFGRVNLEFGVAPISRKETAKDSAREALMKSLDDRKPHRAREVTDQLVVEGVSKKQLERVASELDDEGVLRRFSERSDGKNVWYWQLRTN